MTTELLAGRMDVTFATLPSVIGYIDAGVLRALAVASAHRAARLPNIPTLAEAGVPGVEADAWFALFAPAKTPPAVIDALYRAVSSALSKPAAREAIARQGMTLSLRPPGRGRGLAAGRGRQMGGGHQVGRHHDRVKPRSFIHVAGQDKTS